MSASQRGILTVNMSLANDLVDLRSMSTACEGLTEEGAAWLGYIPSLIYCTMENTGMHGGGVVTPSMRFRQTEIAIEPGPQRLKILQRFVWELLSGQRDPIVAPYYSRFSSVGANSLVSYPLCYVKEIFKELNVIDAVGVLLNILTTLESHLSSKHSGLAWECTVQVAIILRMLESHWFAAQGPFGLVPEGIMPALAFRILPDECKTLQNAKDRMYTMISVYSSPTLIYVVSANACFPEVEGFVVYTSGSLTSTCPKIVGFQMKTADKKPRKNMDTNVINCGAVLIRGRAAGKLRRVPRDGWESMSAKQGREFIGNSLTLAMPRCWLKDR